MIDIRFYMKVYDLKKKILNGEKLEKKFIFNKFEEYRSKDPVIYNIETTNACNMRCEMCPRTTMMTRKVERLDSNTFSKIIDEIKPFTPEEWENWQCFVEENYGINRNEMSENHFFLHIGTPNIVL